MLYFTSTFGLACFSAWISDLSAATASLGLIVDAFILLHGSLMQLFLLEALQLQRDGFILLVHHSCTSFLHFGSLGAFLSAAFLGAAFSSCIIHALVSCISLHVVHSVCLAASLVFLLLDL